MPRAPIIFIEEEEHENQEDQLEVAPDLVDVGNWAIVVYQPPMIEATVLDQPVVTVPFGPPLPPEMIWKRSFENLLDAPIVFEVPKPLLPRAL